MSRSSSHIPVERQRAAAASPVGSVGTSLPAVPVLVQAKKEGAQQLAIDKPVYQRMGFVTDEAAQDGSGQVNREVFLSALQDKITGVADEVLATVGQTSANCPYIAQWFAYYKEKDAAHIERSISKYAPETAGAKDWNSYIDILAAAVKKSFQAHVSNGSLEGVPEELPDDLHGKDNKAPAVAQLQASDATIQLCSSCCSSAELGLDEELARLRPDQIMTETYRKVKAQLATHLRGEEFVIGGSFAVKVHAALAGGRGARPPRDIDAIVSDPVFFRICNEPGRAEPFRTALAVWGIPIEVHRRRLVTPDDDERQDRFIKPDKLLAKNLAKLRESMAGIPAPGTVDNTDDLLVTLDRLNDRISAGTIPLSPATSGIWERTYQDIGTLIRDGATLSQYTAAPTAVAPVTAATALMGAGGRQFGADELPNMPRPDPMEALTLS